ncbi:MAG: hypothetical protein WCP21_10700, partial [Armatimonadota bacterium]
MSELQRRAGERITALQAALAEEIVARHYALQPEIWERYGASGRANSLRDAAWNLSYLSEALSASDPLLLTTYLDWANVFFTSIRLPADMLPLTLQFMRDVILEQLAPE